MMIRHFRCKVALAAAVVMVAMGQASAQNFDPSLEQAADAIAAKIEQSGKKKIAAIDFLNIDNRITALGRFLAEEISVKLVNKSRGFTVVDRANLGSLLAEHSLTISGLVNPKNSKKLGQISGVDALVLGTYTPFGETYRLSLKAISTDTAKIVAATVNNIPKTKALEELSNRILAEAPAVGMTTTPVPAGSTTMGLRERLRPGSIKFVVNDLAVGSGGTLSFSIANLSGAGLGIGFRKSGTSVGPCAEQSGAAGFPNLSRGDLRDLSSEPNPAHRLRWFPAGAKASATISIYAGTCNIKMFSPNQTVSVTVMFVIAADDEVVVMPLTAEGVRVRPLSRR